MSVSLNLWDLSQVGSTGSKKIDTINKTTSNQTSTTTSTIMPYAYYQPTTNYSPSQSTVFSPQYIINSPNSGITGTPSSSIVSTPTVNPNYTNKDTASSSGTSGALGSMSFDSTSIIIIVAIIVGAIVVYELVK